MLYAERFYKCAFAYIQNLMNISAIIKEKTQKDITLEELNNIHWEVRKALKNKQGKDIKTIIKEVASNDN